MNTFQLADGSNVAFLQADMQVEDLMTSGFIIFILPATFGWWHGSCVIVFVRITNLKYT